VFTGRYASRPVEVLFDRICRENGITHRLTAPRSPTTTGKIERFHGTARRELLNQTVFDSKAHAQQVIAAWVAEYNTDRPHQSLGRATPAQRFTTTRVATADAGPPLRLTTLAADRGGEDWVTRRVASNGVISVAWRLHTGASTEATNENARTGRGVHTVVPSSRCANAPIRDGSQTHLRGVSGAPYHDGRDHCSAHSGLRRGPRRRSGLLP
jgi:Integrase core domain